MALSLLATSIPAEAAMDIVYAKVGGYFIDIGHVPGFGPVRELRLIPSGISSLDEVLLQFLPTAAGSFDGFLFGSGAILHLPRGDYEEIYHLLQTEAPVWITISRESDSAVIDEFTIGNVGDLPEEPVGEGLADASA